MLTRTLRCRDVGEGVESRPRSLDTSAGDAKRCGVLSTRVVTMTNAQGLHDPKQRHELRRSWQLHARSWQSSQCLLVSFARFRIALQVLFNDQIANAMRLCHDHRTWGCRLGPAVHTRILTSHSLCCLLTSSAIAAASQTSEIRSWPIESDAQRTTLWSLK